MIKLSTLTRYQNELDLIHLIKSSVLPEPVFVDKNLTLAKFVSFYNIIPFQPKDITPYHIKVTLLWDIYHQWCDANLIPVTDRFTNNLMGKKLKALGLKYCFVNKGKEHYIVSPKCRLNFVMRKRNPKNYTGLLPIRQKRLEDLRIPAILTYF